MQRLPKCNRANDKGFVYVLRCGDAYKIGFTRRGLRRRVRYFNGELVLTLEVNQRPAVLEYILNNRFASKRLPPRGERDGDKREWFRLEPSDLDWLRGLASHLRNAVS